MKHPRLIVGFLVVGSLASGLGTHEITYAGLDVESIEKAIGKSGDLKDGVYKVSLPRQDLAVTLDGVRLKPGFALGSWIAFKAVGDDAVMDGDLVLTEQEVRPVVETLQKRDVNISALHNHLIGETPRVMYLHVAAKGQATRLAEHIKAALTLTNTPIGSAKSTGGEAAERKGDGEAAVLDADAIQRQLGRHGTVKGGVLHISIPRSESITMAGTTLPPTMGMATVLNFQDGGTNKIATTGDFVLTQDEVGEVTKALAGHGVLITALHNHLVHGSPHLYFMHFWSHDTPERVTKGLKAALDAMKVGGDLR